MTARGARQDSLSAGRALHEWFAAGQNAGWRLKGGQNLNGMIFLKKDDPEVAHIIEKENNRQQATLDMIAAESTAPLSIIEALGSVFNNKSAEGYPGRRYHTGCQMTDELEQLAMNRAKSLFEAEHANVQPHSGVNANLAVYQAVLNLGDPLLSMKLSHGGHLSHGNPASMTGHFYRSEHYGVSAGSGRLDYDEIRDLARKHRPKLIIAGGSSYPRLIDYEAFRSIANEVSAYLLVDMAHIAGLVAAKVIPSPVACADFVTFTTYKTLMGPHGGIILCKKDYAKQIDRAVFPGTQGTPTLSLVAAKAVCFELATTHNFIGIQEAILKNANIVAEGLNRKNYSLVTGGTDNHLILIDLRSKRLKGDRAERALEDVNILVNRNLVPSDPESTQVTSGLRLGTTCITERGMRENEMKQIVSLIDQVLSCPTDVSLKTRVKGEVMEFCSRFPIQSSAKK